MGLPRERAGDGGGEGGGGQVGQVEHGKEELEREGAGQSLEGGGEGEAVAVKKRGPARGKKSGEAALLLAALPPDARAMVTGEKDKTAVSSPGGAASGEDDGDWRPNPLCVRVRARTCVRMPVYMFMVCMCVSVCLCVCVCMCVHNTCARTHSLTHSLTHTHTNTPRERRGRAGTHTAITHTAGASQGRRHVRGHLRRSVRAGCSAG